jgi:hypothetical protein
MRKAIAGLLLLMLMLGVPLTVQADAAPPRKPPGSNILPAGETQVQMLAETVSLVVQPAVGDTTPLQVKAVFAMRNQGQATESMSVRFPMENPDGWGDEYGHRPMITNFAVNANGHPLPVAYADEPMGDSGNSVNWATFPVDFPPSQNVTLEVTYTTALFGSNDGTDQATAEYILETGAGWDGPIGSAVITLTLPYAAGPANVLPPNPGDQLGVPGPVFIGNQVRWQWSQFEPDRSYNLDAVFIWPTQWQRILSLKSAAEQAPNNAQAAIALAEAYRDAGSERHGFRVNEPLYKLALQTVQSALVYHPDDVNLQGELALVEVWGCIYASPECSPAQIQQAVQDYQSFTSAHPDSTLLADWADSAGELAAQLTPSDTATPEATQTPAATDTPAPTATSQPSLTPTTVPPTPTALPPTATLAPTLPPTSALPEPGGNPIWALVAGLLIGGLGVWGVQLYRRRK